MYFQINWKIIILGVGIILGGFFFFQTAAFAETYIQELYIPQGETRVFTQDQSPYIVESGIYITKDSKLKIQENVTIKFKKDAVVRVEGELEIFGQNQAFKRVILTSYNDKDVDAEFSGPDNPRPADWTGISFSPFSKGMIQGAIIRYGDAMGIPDPPPDQIPGDDYQPEHSGVIDISQDTEVNIYDTTITNNYGGVMSTGGVVNIVNSEIYDNIEYGVWNYDRDRKVQATNIWWGYNSGPKHQTLNPNGQGNRVNSNVSFDPWQLRQPPVIIVPGILGSWENSRGIWKLDPIFHTYDNLENGFKSQGYKEDENLFPFPYDWRKSNIETAKLLEEKIDEAKQRGKSPRVDIVAHSMGGLVARQYIESDEYQNDVGHLVTLGTPHKGSPDSYLMWEGGIRKEEIIGTFWQDVKGKLMKIYMLFEAKENNYDTLHKYVREQVLSVGELLPVYDYLRDAETGNMRVYPENYPANEFLEDLNSQENLEKFQTRPNLNFSNLVGLENENRTIDIIRVIEIPEKLKNPENLLWPHGYPDGLNKKSGDRGLELGEGDGTVPFESAASIGSSKTYTLPHQELATNTFDDVFFELTGTDPIYPIVPKHPFQRFLFFRLHSPIDFQIIDPQGIKIGKDFTTNEVLSEIQDAFYSGWNTDLEFITIPDPIDGEYKIITQGTGTGPYEIIVNALSDNKETQEQSYSSETKIGENINFEVQYTQTGENPLGSIVNTQESYTIEELVAKVKEYYRNDSIKDVHVKNYLQHLLRGVEIGIKRITQVERKLEEVNEKLLQSNLKPHTRQALEYRKWLCEERIQFHKDMIIRNLNKFIEKVNQYQPNIITPEAAQTLTNMAQNILARY